MRNPIYVALVWCIYGWCVASLAPWLSLYFYPLDIVLGGMATVITCALIVWNVRNSFHSISATGRLRSGLPFTVLQLPLFTLLFYQLFSHFGAQHFQVAHVAYPWDWLVFVCANAFRAADIIDTLQLYGIEIAIIRHDSAIAGFAVVAMRVILDLFFLKAIMMYVEDVKSKLKRRLQSTNAFADDGLAVTLFLCFVIWLGVWLASVTYIRPWPRWSDIGLWFLENIARVLDVPDVMEIFGWKLQNYPAAAWETTLGLVLRLLVAAVAADALDRVLFRCFFVRLGGRGWTLTELQRIAEEYSDEIQELALSRIQAIRDVDAVPKPDPLKQLIDWHKHPKWTMIVASYGGILLLLIAIANRPTIYLARRAVGVEEKGANAALRILSRMGSSAAAAVPILDAGQEALPKERRRTVITTMGHLGASAVEPLAKMLHDADAEFATDAAIALSRIGAPAVNVLFEQGLVSPHLKVREAALQGLKEMGRPAVKPLIDGLTPDNLSERLPLLRELDPYWDLHNSRNDFYRKLTAERRKLMRIFEPNMFGYQFNPRRAVMEFATLGEGAVFTLWERMEQHDQERLLHIDAIASMQPIPGKEIAKQLAKPGEQQQDIADVCAACEGGIKLLLSAYQTGNPEAQEVARSAVRNAAPAVIDRLQLEFEAADSSARAAIVDLILQIPEYPSAFAADRAADTAGPARRTRSASPESQLELLAVLHGRSEGEARRSLALLAAESSSESTLLRLAAERGEPFAALISELYVETKDESRWSDLRFKSIDDPARLFYTQLREKHSEREQGSTTSVPETDSEYVQERATEVSNDAAADDSAAAPAFQIPPEELPRWRVWTTADGKHQVHAKFVKMAFGKVTLQKEDGSTIEVNAEILCEDDKDFLKKRKWKTAAP